MATAVLERDMAKQMGRPKGDRNDVSTRIDKRVVGMARVVATHRGITIAELLSDTLEGPIEKAYLELMAKADKEAKKGGAK
ncbi:MAG: hypothetical protein P4L85_19620 [Paludisphaera borealis]|uniref:hypothetical protein n=1 Tax=Paludisphaera borealis TaxID=1387353 RepID=UPI002851CF86|nr:hypothetical protein [Paludisphaera borealis]MDR3621570.1 hypothetical protein [Paludisphaera borealis]